MPQQIRAVGELHRWCCKWLEFYKLEKSVRIEVSVYGEFATIPRSQLTYVSGSHCFYNKASEENNMKKVTIIITALLGSVLIISAFPLASKVIDTTKAVILKRSVNTSSSVNGIPVEITVVGPKYLKVYNSFKLSNPSDISSYISKRQPQLNELAKVTSQRQIEVVVSPSRKLSLVEFGRKSEKHEMILDELSLDIFINDKWDHTVWFDNRTSVVDISQEASVLTKRIIEVESSRATPPLPVGSSVESTSPHAKMDVTVRYARGRMEAQAAVNLQADSDILLVDPTTDLADAFKDKTREVRVYQMPQLYVEQELRFGEAYRVKSTQQPD